MLSTLVLSGYQLAFLTVQSRKTSVAALLSARAQPVIHFSLKSVCESFLKEKKMQSHWQEMAHVFNSAVRSTESGRVENGVQEAMAVEEDAGHVVLHVSINYIEPCSSLRKKKNTWQLMQVTKDPNISLGFWDRSPESGRHNDMKTALSLWRTALRPPQQHAIHREQTFTPQGSTRSKQSNFANCEKLGIGVTAEIPNSVRSPLVGAQDHMNRMTPRGVGRQIHVCHINISRPGQDESATFQPPYPTLHPYLSGNEGSKAKISLWSPWVRLCVAMVTSTHP